MNSYTVIDLISKQQIMTVFRLQPFFLKPNNQQKHQTINKRNEINSLPAQMPSRSS